MLVFVTGWTNLRQDLSPSNRQGRLRRGDCGRSATLLAGHEGCGVITTHLFFDERDPGRASLTLAIACERR